MQNMLENGQIDLLTSARKTPERETKFDFSRPIGTSSAILTIRSDSSRIVMHDFDSFARENNFTYHAIYYHTTDQMTKALQNGDVDAIVTSSLRQTQNARVIEKFNGSEFYAIDQMNATEGDWRTALYNRFYENYNDRNLTFTEEEEKVIEEYSSKDHPLTVVCDPTRYPYSYVENGEIKGILPDYFKELAAYTGISYEMVACDSREEYAEHRSNGSADLCIDYRINTRGES